MSLIQFFSFWGKPPDPHQGSAPGPRWGTSVPGLRFVPLRNKFLAKPLITNYTEDTYRITQLSGIKVLHIKEGWPPVALLLVNSRAQLIPEWTVSNVWDHTQPEQHHDNNRWTQPEWCTCLYHTLTSSCPNLKHATHHNTSFIGISSFNKH